MVPFESGAALVWLDGRAMSGAHGTDGGAMTVRFTTLTADGTLGADALLDDRVCECCQTALARTTSGLVAAYRDRSPDEIRDIAVTRYDGGAWSQPTLVAADGWRISGCPVNGPQLSSLGDTVAIAWYTAADGLQRVHVAFSGDGGATWTAPTRVDDGDPIGRVDIEMLDDGSAVVVWLERADGADAAIRARRVAPTGAAGPPWTLAYTQGSRASGFPRIALADDRLFVAWTDPSTAGGIRVAAVLLRAEAPFQ